MLEVEEEQLLWGRKVERVLPQRHLQCLLLKQVDPVEREQQVQLMALQQQELVVAVAEPVTHNLELHSLVPIQRKRREDRVEDLVDPLVTEVDMVVMMVQRRDQTIHSETMIVLDGHPQVVVMEKLLVLLNLEEVRVIETQEIIPIEIDPHQVLHLEVPHQLPQEVSHLHQEEDKEIIL